MSEIARKLFEGLKAVTGQALHAGQVVAAELGPETRRLTTQGSMELASAVFHGHGFVPYGPGQYTPSPEHQHSAQGQEQAPVQEQQRSYGIER
ncbi:hypothetical protein Pan44_18820 [Caulifigura coniformis]|uniref:Uncharacterized protein n=1 Tax=Caulifigura coniformis TaxID=2527983 RepID=A0A517SCN2_9PLAN|nr:hypothetical protein [Caulifigura coniformis]QDT53856.1 hypothetical protein Pan44_18820 [Caulifigura coniformis]